MRTAAFIVLVTFASGCFVPVRPVNQDWRFGYMSQAATDENEKWEIMDPLALTVVIATVVAVGIIALCITIGAKSGKPNDENNVVNSNDIIESVCDHWEKCGKWDRKGCVLYHSSVVQSKECLEKQLEAKCDEYNSKEAEYRDVCWPRCKPGPEKCEGSRRLICDDGGLVVIDCGKWCEWKSKGYAGKCKKEPDGKVRCECR